MAIAVVLRAGALGLFAYIDELADAGARIDRVPNQVRPRAPKMGGTIEETGKVNVKCFPSISSTQQPPFHYSFNATISAMRE